MKYLPVVGLEIHLQVKTESKMFCRCSANYFAKDPNVNICPVCFGLPGALPVPNKLAFEKAVKMALALNCTISSSTKFDRKNYFYPDLPKGYQISQFDEPIGRDGFVEIEIKGDSKRIRLQRLHLEEDTAKSLHEKEDETLIDYNKSGVPLIEIVTYPDFEDIAEVIIFAKRLRQIARYNDISDAEMQKGQMRFELNISVKSTNDPAGTLPPYKIEVKNIGSISVLEKVMRFELERQSRLLESGEKITAETRGLKGMTGETLFQRRKETADDYRYFPEPDIPPISIPKDFIDKILAALPEQPSARKQRYLAYGLELEQADILVEDMEKGDWFDKLLELNKNRDKKFLKDMAKWFIGELSGLIEKKTVVISNLPFDQNWFSELMQLVFESKITGTIGKKLLEDEFSAQNKDNNYKTVKLPALLVEENGYLQVSDSNEILSFVKEAMQENEKVVADIAKNPNAIKFLVGVVMKKSRGKTNPKIVEEEIKKMLNEAKD